MELLHLRVDVLVQLEGLAILLFLAIDSPLENSDLRYERLLVLDLQMQVAGKLSKVLIFTETFLVNRCALDCVEEELEKV